MDGREDKSKYTMRHDIDYTPALVLSPTSLTEYNPRLHCCDGPKALQFDHVRDLVVKHDQEWAQEHRAPGTAGTREAASEPFRLEPPQIEDEEREKTREQTRPQPAKK